MSEQEALGFVGIGMMGWPMAAALARRGFDVVAYDTQRERLAQLETEIGCKGAGSMSDFSHCRTVITMLPDSRAVEAVLFGSDGLSSVLKPGALVIDMTSGVPAVTKRLAEQLAAKQISMIDAPVSGGVARARTAELAIMVGGEASLIERATPVLEAMGNVIAAGSIGSGQAIKALNNLVSAGGFLIGVEALLMGKAFGLSSEVMVDILNASTGMNNSTQKKFKQFVLSGAYNSGFALNLMVKDLSIALDIGKDAKVATPFAALCREMWAASQAMLEPGADHTALAKVSEKLAGVTLAE
jgi:3-hydroxyisobutyrate dehydrogenase